MDASSVASTDGLRRSVYWLIIALAAGLMTARLVTVQSSRGTTAMSSANDRSRWSTIRALVDHGTYVLDDVIFRSADKRDPDWYTIDLVRHRGPDGRQHYYSSKPTLLTTLFAAPYWVMHAVSGVTITDAPFYVVRISLLVLHVLPLLGGLLLLAKLADEWGASDWSRLFMLVVAAVGTPLTTFAVTLNNHVPGALCVLFTTALVWSIWRNAQPKSWQFVLAGVLATLSVACELPALSFFAVVGGWLVLKSAWQTLLAFTPAALIVFAGIFGTNYLAHGTWSTAYAHRHDGPLVATIEGDEAKAVQPGDVPDGLRASLQRAGIQTSPQATLLARPLAEAYELWDPESQQRFDVRAVGERLEVRQWDNWYEYPGSYWSSGKKQGVDQGEPLVGVYAFHALIGHHGLLSLTPVWLLSLWGMGIWLVRGDPFQRGLAITTVMLTVVCLTFFLLLRPVEDRNYGGVSCYFRWAIWLIPLWLICLLPAGDWIASRRWLRRLGVVLLAISVFSATYNSLNPWSHPWIFDYWTYLGWIQY